ncbi:lipase member J-like [Petaurus breviceps papuanus]|uniref:lipase member J-like n=1 Tax=Petaurus breviceps papuanus TaxID=3040969 RepID=UPI0036D93196
MALTEECQLQKLPDLFYPNPNPTSSLCPTLPLVGPQFYPWVSSAPSSPSIFHFTVTRGFQGAAEEIPAGIPLFLQHRSSTKSQIIRYWQYPVEEHEVETEDSYILILIRIPYGRMGNNASARRPIVFLQHGLLVTSITWVSNLPNNSLGFLLADAGFDVWMGNSRGTTYSLKHAFLSTHSKQYWAFSITELALYDLPASIDYIVKKTGQKIYYVGHSQGCTLGFVAFSTLPKLAQEVKVFFALAPIFYVQKIRSLPFILLLRLPKPLSRVLLGDKDFLPVIALNKFLATFICNNDVTSVICGQTIFAVFGFDPENLNISRTDVYVAHNPAGTSVWNILQYSQTWEHNLRSKEKRSTCISITDVLRLCTPVLFTALLRYTFYRKIQPIFQGYDWGSPNQNLAHYNQTIPPVYNVSTMEVPTALWSGLRDLLADPKDVSVLIPQIPKMIYHKILPVFDHLAFIWGINGPQEIYYEIIKMIKGTP